MYLKTREEVIKFINHLPDVNQVEFYNSFRPALTSSNKELIQLLMEILEDQNIEEEIRLKCFYGVITFHRRQNNNTVYREICNNHLEEFSEHNLYFFIKSMLYKLDKETLSEAIVLSKLAVEKIKNNPGVLHNYAETIILALEEGIDVEMTDVQNAASCLQTAIYMYEYAKYYYTLGRLLTLQRKYTEAKECIMKAIDLENHEINDYSLRLNEYRNQLVYIRALELEDRVQTDIVKSKQESMVIIENTLKEVENQKRLLDQMIKANQEYFDQSKAQNIQMLAFFTAIISFIISSVVTINKQSSFSDNILLILVFSGALILVNIGLALLISNLELKSSKVIWSGIIGFILILVGLFAKLQKFYLTYF